MSLFVTNLKNYLATTKIKQKYISRKSGIEENKLSRILNGVQEPGCSEMELISTAIGKSINFFLVENPVFKTEYAEYSPKISFYAGNPNSQQTKVADNLLELMENIDLVLSAEGRFLSLE